MSIEPFITNDSAFSVDSFEPKTYLKTSASVEALNAARNLPLDDSLFAQYEANIANSQTVNREKGITELRRMAAEERQNERVSAVLDLFTSDEGTLAERFGMQSFVQTQAQLEPEADNSIEILGYDALSDMSFVTKDRYEALVDAGLGPNDDFDSTRRRQTINTMTWQNMVNEEFSIPKEERNALNIVPEMIMQAFPLYMSEKQSGIVESDKLTDNILAGKAQREEARTFMDAVYSMEPEEFNEFARGVMDRIKDETDLPFGLRDVSAAESLATELVDPLPKWATNSMNGLDNVPLLGLVTKPVVGTAKASLRAASGIRATAPVVQILGQTNRGAAANAVKEAANKMAQEGAEKGSAIIGGTLPGDIWGNLMANVINPWGPSTSVSLVDDVDRLSVMSRALQDYLKLTPTARLNPEEAQKAIDVAVQAVEGRAGRSSAKDVGTKEVKLADGSEVTQATFVFGRKDGEGFANEKSALRYANSNGFAVTKDELILDGDKWFVPFTTNIAEQEKFFTTPLQKNVSNTVSGFLMSGARKQDENLHAGAVVGSGIRQRLEKTLLADYASVIRGVSRRDQNAVAQIWQAGGQQKRWFNRNEFDRLYEASGAKGNQEKAWNLYQKSIEFNDIDYLIRNDAVYKDLSLQGYETIDIPVPGLDVKQQVGRFVEKWPDQPVLNTIDGSIFKQSQEIPDGFRLVQMREPVELSNGYRTKYILAPKGDIQASPLVRHQLAYAPGGHRAPQGEWFVKQGQRHKQPDGSEMLLSPKTFVAGRTRAEAKAWGDLMEQARLVMRDDTLDEAAKAARLSDILDGQQAGVPTGKEFFDAAEQGKINLDDSFEVVEDRALPSVYSSKSRLELEDTMNPDEFPEVSQASTYGRMYYSRRGDEVLKDWQGNDAPTLDLYEMMNMSLNNIANSISLGDYKIEAVNRFYKTYATGSNGILKTLKGDRPIDVLMRPLEFTDAATQADRASALSQQQMIKHTLNYATPMEQNIQGMQRQFMAYVAGNDPKSWRNSVAASATEWWSNQDPVSSLRGYAFDTKLGMFNIVQLPLQTSTMFAAASLSPKHGAQSFKNVLLSRWFLNKQNPDVKDVNLLISRGAHKLSGMEADEYRSYMLAMRDSGFFKVGGQYGMINASGPSKAFSNINTRVGDFREAGRYFFYEAENLNRQTAGGIAWRETRELMPSADVNSPEFRKRWLKRTDDYAFNMDRASNAAWQEGPTSMMTQFWAYSARMAEIMFGKQFGPQQRRRLIAGQTFLYGMYGVPGLSLLPYASDKLGLTQIEQEEDKINTARGMLMRGALDHLFYNTAGIDVLIGERQATGGMIEEVVRSFIGDSSYGDTTAFDVMGGASASIFADIGGDAYNAMKYVFAEAGHDKRPLTAQAFRELAMNVSTVSTLTKAYLVDRYGIYTSNSGNVLADDIPSSTAFAIAIYGAAPGELNKLSADFAYLENRKEVVTDIANQIRQARQLVSQDPAKYGEQYADTIFALRELTTADIWVDAQREVGNDFTTSIAESVEQSVMKMRGMEDAARAIESAPKSE